PSATGLTSRRTSWSGLGLGGGIAWRSNGHSRAPACSLLVGVTLREGGFREPDISRFASCAGAPSHGLRSVRPFRRGAAAVVGSDASRCRRRPLLWFDASVADQPGHFYSCRAVRAVSGRNSLIVGGSVAVVSALALGMWRVTWDATVACPRANVDLYE